MKTNNSIRIVLVDDSPLFLERLATLLSGVPGVDVVGQANDVPSGLKLIQEICPDVLVLDIGLPGQSGIELLSVIKQREPSPVVIMLTNYNIRQMRERCMELGADFYFYKPDEFEKALEVCRDVLALRQNGKAQNG